MTAAQQRAEPAVRSRGCAPVRAAQLQDPLAAAELLAVSAESAMRARVVALASSAARRSKRASRQTRVSHGAACAALKFDDKSPMTLPGLGLTGGEPFSMTAWVYLPKIALHPGQTGGSHALVIAGQMTAGDPEAKPAVPSVGWVFEIDEGVARLQAARQRGKSDSGSGAVQQTGESRHVESPHVHLRRQPDGKRLRVLHERHPGCRSSAVPTARRIRPLRRN